ncbi:efflux RND transporter permease subunit [Granulicella tundricola]|uniref:Acriflavin resistance protein n=1 Tax=Granulicella tundricola (strain ATCC BAA-1859 / DSM 23138 / MP5ACTX9) TaxID=1198114 RepID=E8X2U0_GRATM|nr:efflux RND transporter permease subunit [Granulicella tundricola]ADW70387.1 acriflavin resistance protein [Granulicella tundricola MP5ACTX9]
MWIVKLALRRPYTFVVLSLLIFLLGIGSAITAPKDIFPAINIPVVTIVWTYSGLTPTEMEGRIVTVCERALTTTVNDIEHSESESYQGVSVIKVYFQPDVKIELAVAQVTSIVQTILRTLPPGSFPPFIIKYDASTVPILQLSLSGQGLSESDLYDLGLSFIRPRLSNVKGASIPLPYGGKVRQIMVDADPNLMYAKHLSAADVGTAIAQQNLILPAGTARIGDREYVVKLNSSPNEVSALNDLPIRAANGSVVFIKDVAQVEEGFAVQTNIVRENGKRGALLTVLKNGATSTLDIVDGVKKNLPKVLGGLPPNLKVTPLFDQSIFVRESISEVAREATIAAALTGLMILLFLGSWRSTLIVCTSIPLSIATSLVILTALGETINVMTLGGLALAVGILVDDATVEIENTHRNMSEKKPLVRAILDSAQQVAAPAFVSTLSICIVFIPVVLLTGAAKYLFTPLAMAVAFAMMASYFLSRTIVPTMMHFLLASEIRLYQDEGASEQEERESWVWRWHMKFDRQFEKMQHHYKNALEWCLENAGLTLILFFGFILLSLPLTFFIGEDFFPYVDSGQMRLHVNPPVGLRIEDSEQYFASIEKDIRALIPPDEIDLILDNIGLPTGGINLAFGNSATISNSDGEIQIALKPGKRKTTEYQRLLRDKLAEKYPGATFFFTPANITNQILDFGLPAPIDVAISGRGKGNYVLAQKIMKRIAAIPGAVDVHIHQQVSYPTLQVNVDRTKARQIGLTQQEIAQSTLISLTGTGQTAPNEWLNPLNGVNYQIVTQTPQYRLNSLQAMARLPITSTNGNVSQLLGNLATFKRDQSPIIIDHYNIQPVYDIYADVDRRDLGGVAGEINKIIKEESKGLPPGNAIDVRGEVTTMQTSFIRLGVGIVFAIGLVYLLMAVNFQSWLDPLIILMAIPGAFSGILWMLFVTQTTFNVPSLMGTIMTIGVATANSILMVVFANDERIAGKNQFDAALNAGHTRLRPVLMTALAMIIGMLPMALALGEGGEQNAPLGRAVIGGLLFATVGTLFIVPVIYSLLKKNAPVDYDKEIDEFDPDLHPEAQTA